MSIKQGITDLVLDFVEIYHEYIDSGKYSEFGGTHQQNMQVRAGWSQNRVAFARTLESSNYSVPPPIINYDKILRRPNQVKQWYNTLKDLL